jgi:ferrous iron transport protein A
MKKILLRHMKKGQSGNVASIKANGELGRRLQEMGLVSGTKVTVAGRAPLKDPVAIRIMGSILTLRNSEADHILVDVLN